MLINSRSFTSKADLSIFQQQYNQLIFEHMVFSNFIIFGPSDVQPQQDKTMINEIAISRLQQDVERNVGIQEDGVRYCPLRSYSSKYFPWRYSSAIVPVSIWNKTRTTIQRYRFFWYCQKERLQNIVKYPKKERELRRNFDNVRQELAYKYQDCFETKTS